MDMKTTSTRNLVEFCIESRSTDDDRSVSLVIFISLNITLVHFLLIANQTAPPLDDNAEIALFNCS